MFARTATVSRWIAASGGSGRDTEIATTERRSIASGGVRLVELVVQLGATANAAKVFKAHAAPLGLCDNLINALKLLANQQKDGESPIQSIVTGLRERSRRDIMDGLRSFVRADIRCAVDVGHLREGTRLHVQKTEFQ